MTIEKAPTIDLPTFLRRIPKAELHCHVVGTLRPATLAALARKHGLALPRAKHTLYQYRGFHDFIEVFRLASRVLVDADDFARVAYEYIESAHRDANLRHIELFFNPSYHYPYDVSYATQLDGLLEGLRAARKDFAVSGLLIPSIDREFGLDVAHQVMDDVLARRADEVAGIGLDGPEDRGPPARFAAIYERAGKAGLKRTAHVCEDYAPIPATNYLVCKDVLGCDRLDHGYRMLADPKVVRRAAADGISFTCCPKPSTRERDALRIGAIGGMLDAGIAISLATDDPLMFATDLVDCYERACTAFGWDLARIKTIALAGVDASWLDPMAKASLRAEFTRELDTLAMA
ncbi:MAG: adenosine deaminase [Burkholderiales bacterium]